MRYIQCVFSWRRLACEVSKWMKPLCFQSRTIRVSRFTLAPAQRCTGIYLPGEA